MILHISHNDLDGVGCGILVKACIPSVHTLYVGYDDLENAIESIPDKYSTVIISDLGPSQAAIERILAERELILIDHHVSTQYLSKKPFAYHSIEKCATNLTYDYFTEQGYDLVPYKNFVACVNDYDLWQLKRADSLQMNILFTLLGIERFEKRFYNEPYESFKSDELMLINTDEERRAKYLLVASKHLEKFTDTQGRKFGVIFAEFDASELGNHLLIENAIDYVMIINAQRKKVSLRSVKNCDISDIAISNGGGGHKNAAGFPLQTDFGITELLEDIGMIR